MTLFERNRGFQRGLTLTIGLVAASLLLVATAEAQSAKPPPYPTGVGSPSSGYMIDDVNPASSTITLGGETYRVTPTSKLVDARGNTIRLRDLRGIASHGVADIAKIESRKIGGASTRPEVVTLTLVDLAP